MDPMDDGDQDYVPVHCNLNAKIHNFLEHLDVTDTIGLDDLMNALDQLQQPTGSHGQVPSMSVQEAIKVRE